MRTSSLRLVAGLGATLLACAGARPAATKDLFPVKKRLVRELMVKGEWTVVLGELDRMHAERPRDAEVLALRGAAYHARGLDDAAEADLTSVLATDEHCAFAHATLALVYDASGRSASAEAEHLSATRLEPENAVYLNNLGFSLLVHGRPLEAVLPLSTAARLAPTSSRVRNNLGFALAASGDHAAAARAFAQAGPRAEEKNNLGFAEERRGRLAEALRLYVAATDLDGGLSVARRNLAAVSLALGREANAEPGAPEGAPREEEAK